MDSLLILVILIQIVLTVAVSVTGSVFALRRPPTDDKLQARVDDLEIDLSMYRDALYETSRLLAIAQVDLIRAGVGTPNEPDTDASIHAQLDLYEALAKYFDLAELRDLAFTVLTVPADEIGANTTREAAQKIVERARRHGQVNALRDAVLKLRPHIDI